MVLEIPPADDGVFNGSVMNYWQAAIEDVGPGGVDKGKGGKYLILPPGLRSEHCARGYIAMPSDTYPGLRAPAVRPEERQRGRRRESRRRMRSAIKVYPLSQAANPSADDVRRCKPVFVFDSTIPYDLRFFESLNEMVQAEPWLERDKAMIDQLKTIGIERGKSFQSGREDETDPGRARFRRRRPGSTRDTTMLPPFYEGERWFFPYHRGNDPQCDEPTGRRRIPIRSMLVALPTPSLSSARNISGQSQYYLLTGKRQGWGSRWTARTSYRLRVPANVPVTQYWSMTVYNRETHTFIREGQHGSAARRRLPACKRTRTVRSISSSARRLRRAEESNWVPTDPNGLFEVLARFYGPQKPLFDKTWKLHGHRENELTGGSSCPRSLQEALSAFSSPRPAS